MVNAQVFGLRVVGQSGYEQRCYCPFHQDSHPSATYNMAKGLFYCHACKKGYGAKALAKALGLQIEIEASEFVPKLNFSYSDATPAFYGEQIENESVAAEYLASRGVALWQVGLMEYSQSKNAILFPLKNLKGRQVGAMARFIKPQAHSMRYMLIGEKTPVWRLPFLSMERELTIVTEGLFSCLALMRVRPMDNRIQFTSCLGTNISNKTLDFLSQMKGKVFFLFDDDIAGQKAAARLEGNRYHFGVGLCAQEVDSESRTNLLAILDQIISFSGAFHSRP